MNATIWVMNQLFDLNKDGIFALLEYLWQYAGLSKMETLEITEVAGKRLLDGYSFIHLNGDITYTILRWNKMNTCKSCIIINTYR